jgi:hypothetical protein
MEHLPPVLDPGVAAQGPQMSLPARLLNVIATPGEVFEQIKNAPVVTAHWLAPALIAIAVSWVGVWLVFSQPAIQQQLREITDQAIDKQVQSGKLNEQQAEQARAVAAKIADMSSKIGAYGAPVLFGFFLPFWWGLWVWLVGTKALGADFSYMKGVEVAGLAGMIGVLDGIVRTLLILAMGNLFASPSLALLLKHFNPQNPAHALLAIVNIMTFWILAVRSVGLAHLARATFSRAACWIFGIWAVQTGLLTGLSFGLQKLFAR